MTVRGDLNPRGLKRIVSLSRNGLNWALDGFYPRRFSSSTEWCPQASAPRDLLYYSVRPSASFPPVCVDLVVIMVVKAVLYFSRGLPAPPVTRSADTAATDEGGGEQLGGTKCSRKAN